MNCNVRRTTLLMAITLSAGLIALVPTYALAENNVDIQADWVHIGDTDNSNWDDFGGTPTPPPWSTTFNIPAQTITAAQLFFDIRDAELATNPIEINSSFVGNLTHSPTGQILTSQMISVDPNLLQIGQNTFAIPSLGSLPSGDLDDVGIANVYLHLVPEPSSLGLLAIGMSLFLRRRRRSSN